MSTTTVSFRSTTRDADLAAARQREAAARAAARESRRRAEAQRHRQQEARRQAEAERQQEAERQRRRARAQRTLAEQEARFEGLVARLDEAAGRLPDLALSAPRLAAMDAGTAQDPAQLEASAAQVTADVAAFADRVAGAIAEAERLLERRLAKAAAWRRATDLEQRLEQLAAQIRAVAMQLGTAAPATPTPTPGRPEPEAELEAVEAYEAALRGRLAAAEGQRDRLVAQAQSRERALALSGTAVQTRTAGEALNAHARAQRERAVTALAAFRDGELARAGLCLDELPAALQAQLAEAVAAAQAHDFRPSIARWIAREQQRRAGVARALALLQCAPELVHEDAGLAQRWANLAEQLQRIAGGLEDFHPSVAREYAQLDADARRLVNAAFSRADWVQAMCAQGFEVLERQDGQGLVVVDLDHPEVWLEATEYEDAEGGFATSLELKTDADRQADAAVLAGESRITDAICAKLARAAASGTPEVAATAEVVEHEDRIKRARRPPVARKTFAQRR